MKLSAQTIGSLRIAGRHSRRGVLLAWSIFVILAAGLIAGGLFNVIWLSGVRNQARHCTDSAALAAGRSYLSDDLLRARQQPFEHEGRATRCQNAAISLVEEYRLRTSLPPISQEHVRMDWATETSLLHDPSEMVPSRISVSFDNTPGNASRVPLFFAGLTGLRYARLGVCSSVVIEHAPAAFRPGPRNCVPVLPFGILDQGSDSSVKPAGSAAPGNSGQCHWADQIETGKGKDSYSWNSTAHQFEFGPDGLPEITVTISPGAAVSGPDAFVPMGFCAVRAGQASTRIPEWIESGLSLADLQSLGLEELSFPGSLPKISLTSQQLTSVAAALHGKVGEPCLVCLCADSQPDDRGQSHRGSDKSPATVSLKRPVAARIVQVVPGTGSAIKVTLQPCILVTSTAVTSTNAGVASNRYVYSVRLGH